MVCGNKMPTRCNRWFLLQILLFAQHVSEKSWQTFEETSGYVRPERVNKWPNSMIDRWWWWWWWHVSDIIMPETCWASNKICNKTHLLRLDGNLFPHINDDARSKSLQIYFVVLSDTKFDVFVRSMQKLTYFKIVGYSHVQHVQENHCNYVKIDN